MAKTKKRFTCPKHEEHLTPKMNRSNHGKFFACDSCYKEGNEFTVEGDYPHRAGGSTAEALGIKGESQVLREFPTEHEVKKASNRQKYEDVLDSITGDEERDGTLLKKKIEREIHSIGGEYRKVDVWKVRRDLENRKSI